MYVQYVQYERIVCYCQGWPNDRKNYSAPVSVCGVAAVWVTGWKGKTYSTQAQSGS